jgi:predicted nucleotidyltransferase
MFQPDLRILTCQNVPKIGTIVPIMRTTVRTEKRRSVTSLGDALFSGTRQRLLGLLFGNPGRSYYARELIRLAAGGAGAVQRELERLSQSGLLTVRSIGNQKHYQANQASPVFAELWAIARKSFALADPLREALKPLVARIEAAFVYGSVARREDTAMSDVDLMVIAEKLSYSELLEALEPLAGTIGRRVNPTVMSRREWTKRVSTRSAFASRLMAQPKIWLIGNEDVLRA